MKRRWGLVKGAGRAGAGRTLAWILLASAPNPARADAAAADDAGPRFFGIPVATYAPETSLLLGAGGILSFDTVAGARRSQLAMVLGYTFKNQFVVQLTPEISLDRWELLGALEILRFPDSVYPLGNDAADHPEAVSRFSVAWWPTVLFRISEALRLGVRANLGYLEYLERPAGGTLATSPFEVNDGGAIVGLGPIGVWDSRDNTFAPTVGARHELLAVFYDDLLGGVADYAVVAADLRLYSSHAFHTLALNAVARFSVGDPPFDELSRIGGSNILRGYFSGRRRDRHMVAAQAEYRSPLWWRFGGAVFIAAGRVAGRFADLGPSALAVAAGMGVRFVLIPEDGARLRLDAAVAEDGSLSLYLNVGEAF